MTRANVARGAVVLALILAPMGAWGGEVVHRLAEGETLADVAQRYWGEGDWADLLRTHNRLPSGPPRAGLELRVPVPEKRSVEAGDTWASLAEATLDDAALGPLLSEMNRTETGQPPPVGSEIVAPGIATYRLGKGETLAAVARRFLSDTGQWKMLARLNHFGNPHSLRAGTELRVPVQPKSGREPQPESAEPAVGAPESAASTGSPKPPVAASETAPPPDDREASAEAPTPETEPEAESPAPPVSAHAAETQPASLRRPIREAVNAYLDGRYEEAREQFKDLRAEAEAAGSHEDQVTVLEYLTLVNVAFDSEPEACEAYFALRDAEPSHRWDPDRISPKVIRMTSLCRSR